MLGDDLVPGCRGSFPSAGGTVTRLALGLVLILSLAGNAEAQTQRPREFSRLKVQLVGGRHFEATDGILTDARLTGIRSNGAALQVPRSEIIVLEYVDGTLWRTGALAGAATGALIMLLEALDPMILENGPTVASTGVAIGIGALAGAIWGSTKARWVELEP